MKIVIFQFELFGINTYVVYDPETRDCAVIDPGMSSAHEEDILTEFLDRNDFHLRHVINTHLHIDHAIGNSVLSRRYQVPVLAHRDDEFLGKRMMEQAHQFGLSLRANVVGINRYLEEGDVIHIGNGELKVLHIPGHSPGSVVLYDEKDNFLIAGDVLFEGSIGRTDLPGGSFTQLITGIKEKLLTLPDNTLVYPGHGPVTTIGAERRNNPYLK